MEQQITASADAVEIRKPGQRWQRLKHLVTAESDTGGRRVKTTLRDQAGKSRAAILADASISLADVVQGFNAQNKQLGQGLRRKRVVRTREETFTIWKRGSTLAYRRGEGRSVPRIDVIKK